MSPKKKSKESTRVQRSEPHFRHTDGAFLSTAVMLKMRKKLANTDPNVTAEEWLEHFKLGPTGIPPETCWYDGDGKARINKFLYIQGVSFD